MNQYEVAAIIGFWRSGSKIEEIATITGFDYNKIEKIISDYNENMKQTTTFLVKNKRDLVNYIISLNEGESTFLSYSKHKKTVINNCVASARIRIAPRGLLLKTVGTKDGKTISAYRQKRNLFQKLFSKIK